MLLRPLLKPNQTAKKNRTTQYLAVLFASLSFSAFCQEVDIKATLNTTGYIYETQIGDDEAKQSESILINPSILGSYASRRLSASLSANHSIVRKNSSSDSEINSVNNSTGQNYTDLKYTSTLDVLENALSLTLSGAQNYRNISQQQDYFSDKILASEGLTKTQRNTAQLNFSIPNPVYLGFDLQSNYSKTKTDRSQVSELGLDNDNLGVTARLYQGRNIRSLSFDISAQYNDTSRTNFQNFESTRVQGNLGIPIYEKVDFLITGSVEEYDTGQSGFIGRPNLDTSSYGAGLRWKPSNARILSLTYNQLDEGDNQTNFLGLNLAWAFSPRTALNFDYGKRFYGDAYSLNFKHSLKSLRTSISYSEDITSYSRLGANNGNIIGIFVCEFGSTALADCFQPDSPDYQLQAGEEFRAIGDIDSDISDEVLFRKSGTVSIGYDKRRVKISIDATYNRTEYLESNRLSTNQSLRFNFNYALGRKTDISFASSVSRNQFSELDDPDTIVTSTINFKRALAQRLKLNISARLLDRESDNVERDGSDKRLTVGLSYTF